MLIKTNAEILKDKGYTFIYHITRIENFNKLKENPYIMTPVERHKAKIKANGTMSITYIDFNNPYEIASCEYPGIFMGLTNKTMDDMKEWFKDGACVLIFPLELMNQKNWHFNINDRNGFFYQDTITSDRINEIPNASELPLFNEVVFHNNISASNIIEVIDNNKEWTPEFKLKLDLETIPCYIYYTGYRYSGIEYPFFCSPTEKEVSIEFMYNWYQKYLPDRYKNIINNNMSLEEMDNILNNTKVEESGLNIVDHFFRFRI